MSTNNQTQQKTSEKSVKQNIKQDVNSAKKTAMDLEKLKKEYSLQLNAYKQAVADYANNLKQNTNKDSLSKYATIPEKAFWGTGSAGNDSYHAKVTVEKCKALCASNSKCTGATFIPSSTGDTTCFLRTGEGDLSPGSYYVGIIPESQKYLLTVESINKQLIKTNKQIQQIIKQSKPVYDSIKIKSQAQNKELIKGYTQLIGERDKIEEMLKAYQDLDESEKEGEITITKNYYSYILLVAIMAGAFILLYTFSSTLPNQQNTYMPNLPNDGSSSTSKYYILLIIIIVILIITSYTNIKSTASNVSSSTYNSISSLFSNMSSIFSSRY